MLLILTNSFDGTTDLLVPRLPSNNLFRLNCDLLGDYEIEATQDGFSITDKSGRQITSHQIQKLYYRKPWITPCDVRSTPDNATDFRQKELHYLISEVVNILWSKGKIVLVEPYAERRCGKILQLMIAKEYFRTPSWHFTYRRIIKSKETQQVVKTLSGEQVANDKVLYTTRVNVLQLDPSYPWFIQDYVNAIKDITVVFCRDKIFAFCLERSFLELSADWREYISQDQKWKPCELPLSLCDNIRRYMEQLRLHFGRLDFLMTNENEFIFCEVNPNGQYGWLDLDGKNGLLDCIVAEISPTSSVHPIPHLSPIVGIANH